MGVVERAQVTLLWFMEDAKDACKKMIWNLIAAETITNDYKDRSIYNEHCQSAC